MEICCVDGCNRETLDEFCRKHSAEQERWLDARRGSADWYAFVEDSRRTSRVEFERGQWSPRYTEGGSGDTSPSSIEVIIKSQRGYHLTTGGKIATFSGIKSAFEVGRKLFGATNVQILFIIPAKEKDETLGFRRVVGRLRRTQTGSSYIEQVIK